jgi:hypothetical protein
MLNKFKTTMEPFGRLVARIWWNVDPTRFLDVLPGFRQAYVGRYNAWAEEENRKIYEACCGRECATPPAEE